MRSETSRKVGGDDDRAAVAASTADELNGTAIEANANTGVPTTSGFVASVDLDATKVSVVELFDWQQSAAFIVVPQSCAPFLQQGISSTALASRGKQPAIAEDPILRMMRLASATRKNRDIGLILSR